MVLKPIISSAMLLLLGLEMMIYLDLGQCFPCPALCLPHVMEVCNRAVSREAEHAGGTLYHLEHTLRE